MLLYESLIIDDVLKLSKKTKKSKTPQVEFTTRNGSPFYRDCNYVPVANTQNKLIMCKDKNIVTIGINFLANNRNVRILKGFSTLEVFGGAFYISQHTIRIAGNFNLNKYSVDVPVLSLIVEDKVAAEDGTYPRNTISFYYNKKTEPHTLKLVKRETLHKEVTTNNLIVNLTFFKRGVDTVYMVPSQKILSDMKTKEEVMHRIGRKPTAILEDNIILAPNLAEAKVAIKARRLKEDQLILISDSYKRNELY